MTVDLKKLRELLASLDSEIKSPFDETVQDMLAIIISALEAKVVAPPAPVCTCTRQPRIYCPRHGREEQAKEQSHFLCAARHANTGPNDPQDCDWPVCGCDSYADRVIEALQESGKLHAGQAHAAPGAKEPKAEG